MDFAILSVMNTTVDVAGTAVESTAELMGSRQEVTQSQQELVMLKSTLETLASTNALNLSFEVLSLNSTLSLDPAPVIVSIETTAIVPTNNHLVDFNITLRCRDQIPLQMSAFILFVISPDALIVHS